MKVIIAVMICCTLLAGCNASPEQIAQWRDDLAWGQAELTRLVEALAEDPDAPGSEALRKGIDWLQPRIARLEGLLVQAESGTDVLEIVITSIASIFGVGSIVGPIMASMRRTQNRVFESIRAGGGPKNTEAARKYLSRDPRAYARYKRWEMANGG